MDRSQNREGPFFTIREGMRVVVERLAERYGVGDTTEDWGTWPESPIEDRFERGLRPVLHSEADSRGQVEIVTRCGTFRVDYLVACRSRRVVFECDGRGFHEESVDEVRDALILGTSSVDVVYRIRGVDIMYRLMDCMALLSQMEPVLFSDNGRWSLEAEAHWLHRESGHRIDSGCGIVFYPEHYRDDENDENQDAPRRNLNSLPLCISRRDLSQGNIQRILEVAAAENCSSKEELFTRLRSLCPEVCPKQ
jgi:very-short-patch-repair endonuclease